MAERERKIKLGQDVSLSHKAAASKIHEGPAESQSVYIKEQ